jgi:serine phosphatase RsbU (regulator of sigma subunit)
MIEEYSLDGKLERYFKLYSIYNSKIGKFDSAYFALENYLELKAISDEKSHAQELIAGDIKHQLETDFALKEARHDKEIAEFQNIVYLSIIGFIVLITILVILISSSRRRKRINKLLSEKNKLIQVQKEMVEEKNQSISDSILYARRLQQAILPTTEQVNEYLPESFLFFRPKDIVSGDFYWFESTSDYLFIAVADCTGHGVPGAMVSVVCSNALNRCVKEHKLSSPKDILNKAREIVIETFAKSGDNVADGMDISLVVLNRKSKEVHFAGAHNALWLLRKGDAVGDFSDNSTTGNGFSLLEYKGDKQPVGLHSRMVDFTEKEIKLEKDDVLYLMSDGFADQFGGPNNKKLKYAPIKEYLLEHAHHDMTQQKEGLTYLYDNWRGNTEQIDDVCFIGFRLN